MKLTSRHTSWIAGLILATGLGTSLPSAEARNATPPSLKADAPHVYTVKRGDTLWDISGHFLKKPWRWREIWVANSHVHNPNLIYPNDRLLICKAPNGRTLVGVDDGTGCVGIVRRAALQGTQISTTRIEQAQGRDAIPVVSLGAIRSWLIEGLIVSGQQTQRAPYVLAMKDRRVVAAEGDTIYVRGKGMSVGNNYGVYRIGEDYIDPKTGENLGRDARLVGTGLVTDINGDLVTMELRNSLSQEVRQGDRILADDQAGYAPIFHPHNAANVGTGRIIRVMDGVNNAAVTSVVAINRGKRDGASVGQMLATYQRGALMRDSNRGDVLRLPSERTGLAMIFKTFDRVSYALIMEANNAVHMGDEVRSPNDDD